MFVVFVVLVVVVTDSHAAVVVVGLCHVRAEIVTGGIVISGDVASFTASVVEDQGDYYGQENQHGDCRAHAYTCLGSCAETPIAGIANITVFGVGRRGGIAGGIIGV